MDVFDLKGVLTLDSSKFESGLRSAGSMASSFGSSLASGMKKVAGFTTAALGVASAATTKFVKDSIQTGMTFDAMMGQVGATLGKDIEDMEQEVGSLDVVFGETTKHFEGTLRDFALFMGQNTKFSATEAAEALNYMALAGYDTEKSMNMLPAVLNMAAAGAMDLGRASDMITDTQAALGLSFERTNQMVDEFAKAASSGNTTVEMLGEAFLKVGGLAKELNGGIVIGEDGLEHEVDGIQELEIAFTAMANAGVKGSEAGTHMRNMLLKLSSPTDKGAEAFEALGVSVFDAEGRMRSLADIFYDLNKGLSSVTQAEKLQAIGEIFNARDTASAEALLGAIEGTVQYEDQVYAISTAYEKWGDAIYDVNQGFKITESSWDSLGQSILESEGAAAAMSSRQLNNLKGSITLFKSALETAKITVSDKLTPSLMEFVNFGTEGLQKMVDGFNANGISGAMDAFGDVLSDGLVKVIDKLPNLAEVAGKILTALGKGLLDNMDAVTEAATTIFTVVAELVIKGLPGFLKIAGEVFKKIGEWIMDNSDMILDGIETILGQIVDFIADNAGAFVDGIGKLIGKIVTRLPMLIRTISRKIPDLIRDVSKAIVDNAPILIKGTTDSITEIVKALPEILKALCDEAPKIITTIIKSILENAPTLIKGCIDVIEKIVENMPEIIQELIDEIPNIIDTLFGPEGFLSVSNILKLVLAAASVVQKLVLAIPTIIKSLLDAIPGIITSIIDAFGPNFDDPKSIGYKLKDIFKKAVDVVGGVLGTLGDIAGEIFNLIVLAFTDPAGALDRALQDIVDSVYKVFESIKTIVTGAWELWQNYYESIGREEEAKKMQEYLDAYGRKNGKKLVREGNTEYWADYDYDYADELKEKRKKAQDYLGSDPGFVNAEDLELMLMTDQITYDEYEKQYKEREAERERMIQEYKKDIISDEEIDKMARSSSLVRNAASYYHVPDVENNNTTNNTTINVEVKGNVATETIDFANNLANLIAGKVQANNRLGG